MTTLERYSTRIWGVALRARSGDLDVRGRAALADLHRMGFDHIESVQANRIYLFSGRIDRARVERLAAELLVDAVVEDFEVFEGFGTVRDEVCAIEVHYQPGVMDPVARTTLRAARRMLNVWAGASAERLREESGIDDVRTAWRYEIAGARDIAELRRIATRVLANDCIETVYIDGFGERSDRPASFPKAPVVPFEKRDVPLLHLDDAGLTTLSREGHLFLSLDEMKAIQSHYSALGREPTDVELETLAQTWSEHCVHKTLKSDIHYRGTDFGRDGEIDVQIKNLLKSTIVEATEKLDRDWCLSVFEDNAGVIAFDDEYGVAFKVETHNHPSAIEPYGGAATGAGGCIRDILGCGLGAKPIASTDVFCVADPSLAEDRVPSGVLHPRRVLTGVVRGVRDYGNRMGIPTVNGAIYFDKGYLANPLVFCGCVGLLPRNRIEKSARAGDRIVVVGGRTGRDGIHGATFSSAELTDTHVDEFSHAVQIGNAIEEKKVLDGIMAARDYEGRCLFSGLTDCGAGGLSSAVGEMGEHLGAVVDLDRVPLKYAGLRYDEIWISEAQERMVLAVGKDELVTLLGVFAREEVEATVIGTFTGDGQLVLRYQGETVGQLEMAFLHNGLPKMTREAEWTGGGTKGGRDGGTKGRRDGGAKGRRDGGTKGRRDGGTKGRGDAIAIREALLAALSDLNVASKEWVIRQYDHEVQGGSVVKPLVGIGEGPSDAAVVRPRLESERGIALGCGLCPATDGIDPYEMAIAAVDEALRNVVCVGGDPDRTAILDNFCWGEVDTPGALGSLVRACYGARDAAIAFGLPFVSGKDSLNNQFSQRAEEATRVGMPQRVSIPDTLLISAISVIEEVSRCVTMDLKQPGSRLVCVGGYGVADLDAARAVHHRVAGWIRDGAVRSAHDVSDGGLAVASAEMCIAGSLGATLTLDGFPDGATDDDVLFGERRAFYVLECAPDAKIDGAGVIELGTVTAETSMIIRRRGQTRATLSVASMSDAWRSPLSAVGGV